MKDRINTGGYNKRCFVLFKFLYRRSLNLLFNYSPYHARYTILISLIVLWYSTNYSRDYSHHSVLRAEKLGAKDKFAFVDPVRNPHLAMSTAFGWRYGIDSDKS